MIELIILEGYHPGRTIRLKSQRSWFGRQPTCDVVLEDTALSRIHFAIEEHDGQYVLIDNKSTNGTYINGERVSQQTLKAGDLIAAGVHVMQVRELPAGTPLGFRFVAEWRGGGAGAVIIERAKVLLGRRSICQIQLNDPATAAVHAELERDAEGVWITDLSGSSGVYVNGRRIVRQRLQNHDRVVIRPYEMVVEIEEDVCRLVIDSTSLSAGTAPDSLPADYRGVVAATEGGKEEAKPSAAIAALPAWAQEKAPIWVPSSDILPNRFRSRMILLAVAALLAAGLYAGITHRYSAFSGGPVARVHSMSNADFRAMLSRHGKSSECSVCHSGFTRVSSGNCSICHAGLHPVELAAGPATHQQMGLACSSCHSEHRGAQFDVAREVGDGCQSAGCHVQVHQKPEFRNAGLKASQAGKAMPAAVALEARFEAGDAMHDKHGDLNGACENCHTSGDPTIAVPRATMRMRCLACHGFGPQATLRERCYTCHFEHATQTPAKVLTALSFPATGAGPRKLADSGRGGVLMLMGAVAGIPLLYFGGLAMRFRSEQGSLQQWMSVSFPVSSVPAAKPPPEVVAAAPAAATPAPAGKEAAASHIRPLIDLDLCVGCGTCVHVCPFNVLEIVNEKAIAARLDDCTGYAACAAECPTSAIQLVNAGPMQTVELPNYDANLETNVPGLYLAGEITGKALIKVAINQGKKVVESIGAKRPQPCQGYDVIVVGAGPAGISTALAAMKDGLKVLVLDQGTLAATIRNYPRQKFVMAEPVMLPLHGLLWMQDGSKEELLRKWHEIIEAAGLVVNEDEKVLGLERRDDLFFVKSTKGEYCGSRVVLSIGRRGSPRKLGVKGEDSAKVLYSLSDAEAYQGKAICIVGGGDSGIEAANGLARADLQNRIWLVHRDDNFSRAKPRNQKKLQKSIDESRVEVFLKSRVLSIQEGSVVVQTATGTEEIPNDFVFVMVGGENPKKFLAECGIEFSHRALG